MKHKNLSLLLLSILYSNITTRPPRKAPEHRVERHNVRPERSQQAQVARQGAAPLFGNIAGQGNNTSGFVSGSTTGNTSGFVGALHGNNPQLSGSSSFAGGVQGATTNSLAGQALLNPQKFTSFNMQDYYAAGDQWSSQGYNPMGLAAYIQSILPQIPNNNGVQTVAILYMVSTDSNTESTASPNPMLSMIAGQSTQAEYSDETITSMALNLIQNNQGAIAQLLEHNNIPLVILDGGKQYGLPGVAGQSDTNGDIRQFISGLKVINTFPQFGQNIVDQANLAATYWDANRLTGITSGSLYQLYEQNGALDTFGNPAFSGGTQSAFDAINSAGHPCLMFVQIQNGKIQNNVIVVMFKPISLTPNAITGSQFSVSTVDNFYSWFVQYVSPYFLPQTN